MPAKKSKKSKSSKKVVAKTVATKRVTRKQDRTASFMVGFVVVVIIAFLVFTYAQSNNYKQVKGAQTQQLTNPGEIQNSIYK